MRGWHGSGAQEMAPARAAHTEPPDHHSMQHSTWRVQRGQRKLACRQPPEPSLSCPRYSLLNYSQARMQACAILEAPSK